MKQFRKLFAAHLKMTFREKQVWFWSIFYPVMLLVVFLLIFGGFDKDSSFQAKVAAVVEQQDGMMSTQLLSTLKQIPVLEWESGEPVTREQAEEWVKDKKIDAAIVLPDDSGQEVQLLVHKEKETSTTVQAMNGILGQVLQQANDQIAGVTPVLKMTQQTLSTGSDKLKYVDFLLTGLIALSISQTGLFGMVGMVEMRRNGLLKRLMLSPIDMRLFGLGDISVRFVLSAIQVVLLSLIGIFFFDAYMDVNLLSFLPIFLVGTVSFAAMGYMIASFSRSMESYMGIANLFSFIMMFLSGIFFEYAMLPDFIKPISDVLPLTYFANGIRDGMVYGLGPAHADFWINLGVMAAWGLVTFLIGSRFYKWKA